MNKLRVDTNKGDKEIEWKNNGKGVINRDAITAFTWGHCHSFAYKMHDMTGWPIIGVGDDVNSPGHFLVYSPRIDDYVDIQGPGALKRWEFLAEDGIHEFTPDQKPVHYRPMNKDMAKPFVVTVLDKVMRLPEKNTHNNDKFYKDPDAMVYEFDLT